MEARNLIHRTFSNEQNAFGVIAGLLILKAVLVMALYGFGFQAISADEMSRSIQTVQWAADPRIILGPTTWPPFFLYLNGPLLALLPDPLWAPRLTAFLASCVLMVSYYWLVALLAGRLAAALSATFLIVFHWMIGMSATPALDVYYLAAFITGLAFFAKWVTEPKPMYIYFAALAFFIGTGFHYQSWLILAILELISLWYAAALLKEKRWSDLLHLVFAYLIANAYIFLTMTTNYLIDGHAAPFLDSHKDYSRLYYGGYDIGILQKLLHYPKLLISESNPVVLLTAAAGCVVFLLRGRQPNAMLAPIVVGICLLAAFSVFNVSSVPATAAPGRFVMPIYLCVVPYAAWLLAGLLINPNPSSERRFSASFWMAGAVIVGVVVAAAVQTAFMLPGGKTFGPALEAGRSVSQELQELEPSASYLIELRYWDHLPVELTAGHHQQRRFDRVKDGRRRNLPSRLLATEEDVVAFLRTENVRVAALYSPELVAVASNLGGSAREVSPGWSVVTFPPWKDDSGRTD